MNDREQRLSELAPKEQMNGQVGTFAQTFQHEL